MSTTSHAGPILPQHVVDLQSVLAREIPMCGQMGLRVLGVDHGRLCVAMPLDLNHNHQQTAFAGSLNALCTIAGWGTAYLLLRSLDVPGTIVIRRSQIRYHVPVTSSEVVARCSSPDLAAIAHFSEMYREKGQAKLDLTIEVLERDEVAVSFAGSYVVMS